ncbi:TPA: hypothetical protein OUG05_003238 [Morganella morganii]|nr:hypothetical protein [Morganella morganii]
MDTHPTRKFVLCDSELTIFAGDENPILAEQASILGLISYEDYFKLISNLTDESLESVVVSESTGTLLDQNGGRLYGGEGTSSRFDRRKRMSNLIFIGSGGSHACDFFHYSNRKKSFLSKFGCNIVGSMNNASLKDPATGGQPNIKLWAKGDRYGCLSNYNEFQDDVSSYKTYVYDKVRDMLKTLDQNLDVELSAKSAISSDHCSSNVTENGMLRKVSVGSAVARLRRRLERQQSRCHSTVDLRIVQP